MVGGGYKGNSEWTCEGSLKSLRVGAYGNPVRYQLGAYDGMQNERMSFDIKPGGTAEA